MLSAGDDPGNATGLLDVSYGVANACGTLQSNATVANVSLADPLLVDAAGGDLHVSVGSPAIDSGNPTSACSLEPANNGCRANVGVYGGTTEATANPAASHCAICPMRWKI